MTTPAQSTPEPPTRQALLDGVLADLAAEGDVLEALLVDLDAAGWRTPTPAAGWDVAAQVAHLAWTDEVAVAAATDKEAWDAVVMRAIDDPEGFVDAEAISGGQVEPVALLARWRDGRAALQSVLRACPEGARLPWFGPPMSPISMGTARFMETWAHTLDVAEGLGRELTPTDRVRHVAHLGVRTRDFAFGVNGLEPPSEEFRVELTSPSGELWEWGPAWAAQTVRGSAYDFCLRVTQRRHRDDLDLVATGPDADRWLDVAQAFAGSSGPGRPASSSPTERRSSVDPRSSVEPGSSVEPVETTSPSSADPRPSLDPLSSLNPLSSVEPVETPGDRP